MLFGMKYKIGDIVHLDKDMELGSMTLTPEMDLKIVGVDYLLRSYDVEYAGIGYYDFSESDLIKR